MLNKKSIVASAILASFVSGIALANEAPKAEKAAHAKKTKKGDKDACSGPNGCDGKSMKADPKATPAADKKAE